MRNYLSIDIGGTNLKYGVIDHSGNLLFKQKYQPQPKKADFWQLLNK